MKDLDFPFQFGFHSGSKCDQWSSLSRSVLAWQVQESKNTVIGRTKEGGESQRIWNQGEKGSLI